MALLALKLNWETKKREEARIKRGTERKSMRREQGWRRVARNI